MQPSVFRGLQRPDGGGRCLGKSEYAYRARWGTDDVQSLPPLKLKETCSCLAVEDESSEVYETKKRRDCVPPRLECIVDNFQRLLHR